MDDCELIAAILTAGMLPTLPIPQSRVEGRAVRLSTPEARRYSAHSATPPVIRRLKRILDKLEHGAEPPVEPRRRRPRR